MENKGANVELVINDLLNQIAQLSREKAVSIALATEYKSQLDELKEKSNKLIEANKEKENAKK